jgi:hypothetical protein
MFSLLPVEFRTSSIEGRGVFARRPLKPRDLVVAYAPRQRKVDAAHPDAVAAAQTKLSLRATDGSVIIPDTRVPGGWLCNHSCAPNAAIYASGTGRIQATRAIAAGEEVTVFYGWVSHNDPQRDPCRCGSPQCRGFINFDVSDKDIDSARILEGGGVAAGGRFRDRLLEYDEYLHAIEQDQVHETVVETVVRLKRHRGER